MYAEELVEELGLDATVNHFAWDSDEGANAAKACGYSVGTARQVAPAAGMATGNKVDKAKASGMTFTKSEFVDAPVIEEFPLTMECEVTDIQGDGHGARVVGRVVNTRVDFAKMRPIVYDSTRRIYRAVGSANQRSAAASPSNEGVCGVPRFTK